MIMKLRITSVVIVIHTLISGAITKRGTPEERQNYDISYGKPTNSNVVFSTPQECARDCTTSKSRLTCYYHFTLECYTTMNRACNLCKPSNTNPLVHPPQCQCIEGDGYERSVLSINRMLPGPSIQVCQYDRVVVDVENKTPALEATIHWHGIFQEKTQYYDGVPYVTQCPIHSGTTFRYQFMAANAGTFFYHSHSALHKINGQYGSLIIRQSARADPQYKLYDEDLRTHVILVSDYFHEMAEDRYPGRIIRSPGQIPDNLLINGKGRWTNLDTNQTTTSQREIFQVKRGNRYRFRIINSFSTNCLAELTVQNHTLLLIAQDGDPVVPKPVNSIISGSGERVDVVLTANQTVGSYWVQLTGVGPCNRAELNQLAILQYNGASNVPATPEPTYRPEQPGIKYNQLNFLCNETRPEAICANQFRPVIKVESTILKVKPDYRFILPFGFYNYDGQENVLYQPGTYRHFLIPANGIPFASHINNISNVFPSYPPISQGVKKYCNGNKLPTNCTVPCECSHIVDVKLNSLVEVILYDTFGNELIHPFHLHGYSFHIFDIGNLNTTGKDNQMKNVIADHDRKLKGQKYKLLPRKDTVLVPSGGYVIFRFNATNPGWWLFHCHFIYHMVVGMEMVFHVGNDDNDLPRVPKHFPRCYNFKPEPF
ncbi:oxidoreductase OpS5 [Cephus cinctus]|uniref:Oxidoreductase OpS5 n=1 Tax=Cephus cinctus TaxID=211228 RepID=A0AAJ7CCN6_CEPCN|nr:oxidoreductase OpS5 [Cephus cinctus]